MIYELSILSLKRPEKLPTFYLDAVSVRRSKATLDSSEYNLCAYGLWSTCRQIYYEMSPLIHVNPIRLTILDDLFFNKCADPHILSRVYQKVPWVQQHVKEIRILFGFSGAEFTPDEHFTSNRRVSAPKLRVVYPSSWQIRLHNTLRTILWHKDSAPIRHQPQNSLRNLAAALSSFPQLETIEIACDNRDIRKTWIDFWGDIAALKSTGAQVIIVFFHWAKDMQLLDMMLRHGGQFLMEADWLGPEKRMAITPEEIQSFRTWDVLGDDGTMGIFNSLDVLRVVSPDGTMSVPIKQRSVADYTTSQVRRSRVCSFVAHAGVRANVPVRIQRPEEVREAAGF
jgi:hypothetical protein